MSMSTFRKSWMFGMPLLLASLITTTGFADSDSDDDSDDVVVEVGIMNDITFVPGGPPIREIIPGATSVLVRSEDGLSAIIETSGMGPFHHFTLWFIVRNYDGAGSDDQCVPMAWVGHIGGGATTDADGNATVSGILPVGFIPEQDNTYVHRHFPGGGDMIFDNPFGAEVLLAIRDHGPTQPGIPVELMKSTHGAGCSNDPQGNAGFPGNFPCFIVQQSNFFNACVPGQGGGGSDSDSGSDSD